MAFDKNGDQVSAIKTFYEALAGEDNVNGVLATTTKPVASATYAPLVYAPLTQVTKANIKATQGNIFSLIINNTNAAVRYLQLHNKASAPAAAEVPLISYPIPAGTATAPGTLILGKDFFTDSGINFSTGIGWAVSTTLGTFTDAATNTEHFIVVTYI